MSNRRWISRWMAVLVPLAMVATACGGDDGTATDAVNPSEPGSGGTTAEVEGDVDPDGVLRIGYNLESASGIFFDLTTQVNVPTQWIAMVYDTLLRRTVDGGSEPGLAKAVTIVDPSTLTVELNEGVTFTDGTPLDAEAVKFGIERNINEGEAGSFEVELYELESITVDDPLNLTIRLKAPIAGSWYRLLSLSETSPVSPTAARAGNDFNENPVGAGPFKLVEWSASEHIVLEKNPDFFQADDIRLGGIEIVHIAPDATPTALRSKTVDLMIINSTLAGQLEGTGLTTDVSTSSNVNVIGHLCKSRPPFDDLRVRQALNYALDREALNEAIYGGAGEPMWGFFDQDDPRHDAENDGFYAHDPDRARTLLAEAGVPDLSFEAFMPQGTEGQRIGEVVQQQLAAVGITMTLKPLINQTDFFPEATGAPIQFFPLLRSGLLKVTRVYVPGSYGNVCTWDDPELNQLVRELQGVEEDSAEGIELWHQIERHSLETALTVFGIFGVQATAWDDAKVGDVEFIFINTAPVVNFYEAYVKG